MKKLLLGIVALFGLAGIVSSDVSGPTGRFLQIRTDLQPSSTVYFSSGSVATALYLPYGTAGNCLELNSSGKIVSAAAPCGTGGGGASSLEVFNNFDSTRSSPTAAISLSDAFRGSVSGSTYTFRINFSSVAAVSDIQKIYNATSTAGFPFGASFSTATLTTFSPGSLLFVGASSAVAQDNTNLYYDLTNHQLLISQLATPGMPALSFYGDPDTGINYLAANRFSLESGGTTIAQFGTNLRTTQLFPKTSSDVGLVIRGVASQTANLQNWQNSSSVVLSSVSSVGAFWFGSSTTFNGPIIDGASSAGTSGYVLTSRGDNISPTWQAQSGGGGGSPSLSVGTGTATGYTTQVTSPTAIINFLGTQFLSNAVNTTNYISLVNISTDGKKVLLNQSQALFIPGSPFGSSIIVGDGGQNLTWVSGDDGWYNTFMGDQAGYNNTTGTRNTGIGYEALASNTSGNYNTAIGMDSLALNTTGERNVANGMQGLYNNTTGNRNTTNGMSALIANTTASSNTAIGYTALGNVTTGGGNVGIGYFAGSGITTGTNNTIIGSATGLSSGLSNNIILADGQGNQRINIDSSGNVGIGTNTPSYPLDVRGQARFQNGFTSSSGTIVGTFTVTTPGGGLIEMGNDYLILLGATPGASFYMDPYSVEMVSPDGTGLLQVNNNDTAIIGPLSLSSFNCSSYVNSGKLTVDNNNNVICADDISSGGGGGSSALEVFSNFDATRTSPTASIAIGDALKMSVSGSTAVITVDFSSVTSRADVILNQNSLQSGSTFYVSSGTVQGQLTVESTNGTFTKWDTPTYGGGGPNIVSPRMFVKVKDDSGTHGTYAIIVSTNNSVQTGLITDQTEFTMKPTQGTTSGFLNLKVDGSSAFIATKDYGLVSNQLKISDQNTGFSVGFSTPSTLSADLNWRLPSADGSNGQAIITNGSGQLSFTTISGGGGSGSPLEVFNNFDSSRSSPTLSITASDAFRGSVTGSTYTFTMNSSSVTLQGNTFNAANKLLQLDGSGDVPDANLSANVSLLGSQIDISGETNLTASNGITLTDDALTVNWSSAISRSDVSAAYQPLDATLTDLAAAPLGEDNSISVGAIAAGSLPSDVIASSLAVSGFFSDATVRSNLGLAIGTNVQAWDADLDDLADGSLTGSKVGSGVPAANIASGSLGASVLASSFPATAVTAGSYTNSNITVDAQGRLTAASNGTGGSGDNLGNHVATMTITAGFGVNATTGTFSSTLQVTSTFTVTGGTISINGIPYRFPNSRGSANQVLATDGASSGVQSLSWATDATGAGGGGGASTLAVTTGSATGFSSIISSPTAIVVFSSHTFGTRLTGGATAYVTQNFNWNIRPEIARSTSTTAACAIQNSQSNYSSMLLCDASANEDAAFTTMLYPYNGGPLYADIFFTMASAASGSVVDQIQVYCSKSGDSADVDAVTWPAANSATIAVASAAGYPKVGTISLSTLGGTCSQNSFMMLRFVRNGSNGSDDATGDQEVRAIRVYEN